MRDVLDRAEIVTLDKRYVWHPYTEMSSYIETTEPLVIVRAKGSRLYDADGRSYLDANSSWWVASLGHGHPRLLQALEDQARELAHCALAGITHPQAAYLAKELVSVAPPGLSHVFYSDNGSTAVEVALKMAVQYFAQNGEPRRHRFLALEGAFHGDTVGVASLGGVEVFRRPFAGILFDCVHVPSPGDASAYEQAFDALSRAIEHGADELAAVVLEPLVQGSSGMRIYDAEYLRHARTLCDRHGILLVLDEVFTGYGRTGTMWASEQAGIVPDFLCMAKGYSGGMFPMAATLTTDRIFEGFLGDKSRAFYYGHTYTGNPLGAAVAREVLRIYRDENIIEGIAPRARKIADTFARMANLPGVASARSLGMIGALDLQDEASGYLAPIGWRVSEEARKRGVYLRPLGNVIYVTPPINIAESELDELLGKVEEAVGVVAGS